MTRRQARPPESDHGTSGLRASHAGGDAPAIGGMCDRPSCRQQRRPPLVEVVVQPQEDVEGIVPAQHSASAGDFAVAAVHMGRRRQGLAVSTGSLARPSAVALC